MSHSSVTAYVGIGGNLGTREQIIQRFESAIAGLNASPDVRVLRVSPVYRSAAWGPIEQDDFLNAALECAVQLPARELLALLLSIELENGRNRDDGLRWGTRTLDLDILLFGDEMLSEPDLHIPHPRLNEREFVLQPLFDLQPDLYVPGIGTVADLLRDLRPVKLTRID